MSILIQSEIEKLKKIDMNLEDYYHKSNEILKALLDSNDIYTVVSRETTVEELSNNEGKVFFGLNNNIPTMWLFSQDDIANEYAEYYQHKVKNKNLIRKIEFEELLIVSYFAMLSGVAQVIIDEGRSYLVCNICDLVNECFKKHGQPPVLEREEYPIINVINSVRFSHNRLWVVSSENTAKSDKSFMPINHNNSFKVFTNKSDSEKYSKENNYATVKINISELKNILVSALNNNIENVEFVIANEVANIRVNKLFNLLERMN
jgi:uncharacterized protein (UPF0179 family)